MELEIGSIVAGKVTGITKFGAFVSLPEGKSGLVHISEIAYSYVNEVSDHLSEGQEVKVKVISVDQAGRINLSIKKAEAPPQRQAPAQNGDRPRPQNQGNFTPRPQNQGGYAPRPQNQGGYSPRPQNQGYTPRPAAPKEPADFEDRLKQFMQTSDSKLSEIRYMEKKGGNRRNGNRRGS